MCLYHGTSDVRQMDSLSNYNPKKETQNRGNPPSIIGPKIKERKSENSADPQAAPTVKLNFKPLKGRYA